MWCWFCWDLCTMSGGWMIYFTTTCSLSQESSLIYWLLSNAGAKVVATKPEPSAPWHQTVEPVDQHAHSWDQWLEQDGHQNLNTVEKSQTQESQSNQHQHNDSWNKWGEQDEDQNLKWRKVKQHADSWDQWFEQDGDQEWNTKWKRLINGKWKRYIEQEWRGEFNID